MMRPKAEWVACGSPLTLLHPAWRGDGNSPPISNSAWYQVPTHMGISQTHTLNWPATLPTSKSWQPTPNFRGTPLLLWGTTKLLSIGNIAGLLPRTGPLPTSCASSPCINVHMAIMQLANTSQDQPITWRTCYPGPFISLTPTCSHTFLPSPPSPVAGFYSRPHPA